MTQRILVSIAAVACSWAAISPMTAFGQPGRVHTASIELPAGDAKAFIGAACNVCHSSDYIVDRFMGGTYEDWDSLLSTMIALPPQQKDMVVGYLAENFPKLPGTDPVLIPGPVKVNISEWKLPTLATRPHDPLSSADGSLWWTGHFQNLLGKVHPGTGAMQEFPLKTPGSGPHGLVEDMTGNVWFTAIFGTGYIGKLDPNTGEIDEYPVTVGRGPHTPIFDQNDTLWFTMQSGHVGRLVPSTEEMTITASPTSGSYPYGIEVNSKGVPWYVDFHGNRLGSVDPETTEITEYELPNPDSRPRRITITPDDVVWYTDYPRGYLGRYDPETEEIQEWLSPGGEKSLPYGIASVDDVIWYVETYSRPNSLVRFDIKTEEFQSWAIPSGGGIVRHMVATEDGNLVLASSAVNGITQVYIETYIPAIGTEVAFNVK